MPQIKLFSADFLVYLYMTLFIGKGSFVVAATDYRANPIGIGLFVIALVYLFASEAKCYLDNKAKYLLLILLLWTLAHLFFFDGSYAPYFYIGFIIYTIGGVAIARHYGSDMVYYYDQTLYILALISLPLWAFQMVGGTEVLNSLPFVLKNSAGTSDYSLLLYTINGQPSAEWYGNVIRNCGCAWEPGLYSTMLALALVFRLFINDGQIVLKDKHNFVFFTALITTFSTTGYLMIMILFGLHLLNSANLSFGKRLIIGILALGIFAWVYSLPFMSEKIESKSTTSEFVTEIGNYNKMENTFTVDRFEGIVLDYSNIINDPIVGYGFNRNNSYVNKSISSLILTSNSITKPLAQFGIPLGILLFILLFYSIKGLSQSYNVSFIILLSCVIISSFSYDMFDNPIIRALQVLALMLPNYTTDEYVDYV